MLVENFVGKLVKNAFIDAGYDSNFGVITKCKLPDMGDFSAIGALSAARKYKKSPRDIANEVIVYLQKNKELDAIRIDGPGYINFKLQRDFILKSLEDMLRDKYLLCREGIEPLNIVIDYGGPNIAKPLHVGHLRSAIIGEALKRTALFNGHTVIGDIHLGDWGLQMGMLIYELSLRSPTWPYFDKSKKDNFPIESPITIEDLIELYPTASVKAKDSKEYLSECRKITSELQEGRPGYRALWRHIVNVSIADLKEDYDYLDVFFDYWLGESDADQYLSGLVDRFQKEGFAYESDGAMIIDVAEEGDNYPIPPVMLRKRDGAILYHATDVATIYQRVKDFNPNLILYVVDKRQSLHFVQVFRCVYKTKVVPENLKLEHIPFGTMNGKDGKPFKTREGGILKLRDLIESVTKKALERLEQGGYMDGFNRKEQDQIARSVGLAALKFGDLSNTCARDYIFDLDKFLEFEGKTGPYLLYSTVRAKSILRKAKEKDFAMGAIGYAKTDQERKLMLALLDFTKVCQQSFKEREPKILCEYGYFLANTFSSFYSKVKILTESDRSRRSELLGLIDAFLKIMTILLNLLGIPIPDRM